MIDNLTNWYIRFNRKRLKATAGLGEEDNITSLSTLLEVLFTLVKALAPFTPFVTEHIYGLLKPHLSEALVQYQDSRSVHFLPFPAVQDELVDEEAERKMVLLQKVIQQGRVARERRNLSLKTPLLSVVVVGHDKHLSELETMKGYIREELNVRDVYFTSSEEEYGIHLEAKVDWPTLGKRLKKDVQVVRKGLSELSQQQLQEFRLNKNMTVKGIKLDDTDVTITRVMSREFSAAKQGERQWEAAFGEDLVVLLDTSEHPELAEEGFARELVNRVQRLRKQARLMPTDNVRMEYAVVSNPDGVQVDAAVLNSTNLFLSSLRGNLFKAVGTFNTGEQQRHAIAEQEQDVNGVTLRLSLFEL